jgi:hypothetical protein
MHVPDYETDHGFYAKITAGSFIESTPIVTFELRYPRFIHAELMTHRMFSRNASSSRAIPVKKMLAQVWNHPAHPIHWGQNRPGMQATEQLTGWRRWLGEKLWRGAAKVACCFVWTIDQLGGHKQWANRLLEPWQYISVVLTTTELGNFYELRRHKDAQPEFRFLANLMWEAETEYSNWVDRSHPETEVDAWHLPYVTDWERMRFSLHDLIAMSAACCARVSYNNHDGTNKDIKKDKDLYERLVVSKPAHASPIEHQARPAAGWHYNLHNWKSHRWCVDHPVTLNAEVPA